MALAISYQLPATSYITNSTIFRATGGGLVYTSIPGNSINFDLFTDTAVPNDALYFCTKLYGPLPAGLKFNIGTAIVATSYVLAREYYKNTVGWTAIEDLLDESNSFSLTGIRYIKFPQQRQPEAFTVNGVGSSRLWLRCRIVSCSGWTEGGQQITETVKYGNGTLSISGTDDITPATFTDVYNRIIANQPHISIKKGDGYFDFRKIGIIINSRLVSNNEIIEVGNDILGNNSQGYNNFNYIKSGTKLDSNSGSGGSTIIVHGVANQSVFTVGPYTLLYGATLRTGKRAADTFNYGGYSSLDGEIIDCNMELSVSSPGTGAIINNVRINAGLFITPYIRGTFSNISYICNSNILFYVYRLGRSLSGFGYKFRAPIGASLIYIYQGSDRVSPEWVLINPSVGLNNKTTRPRPVYAPYSIVNIAYMKFYNSTTGTYTDYTTQANNTTTNDVPLSGNVGDILYFGAGDTGSLGPANGFSFHLTRTLGVNDSQYVREYYFGGAWLPVGTERTWDGTDNLSKTGALLFAVPHNMSAYPTTIDGANTCRIRARIVGTSSTPQYGDRFKRLISGMISNWSLQEKYSVDLRVIDVNGAPIEAVNIVMKNEYDEVVFDVNTDSNGNITTQYLLNKKFYIDATQSDLIGQKLYNYITLEIKKSGYETYGTQLGVSQKINTNITLKSIEDIRMDDNGNVYKAMYPELGSSSLLIGL